MSKAFAGFLFALSLFMLFLALIFSQKTPNPLFVLLWVLLGVYSFYRLCTAPSRAS
jgi:hypothetical protein